MYSGMNDNAASSYSYVSNEKLVELNQDIGYLLMKYLNGLDVINFMEAINGSKQFGTIEVTEEDVFRKIFMKTLNKEKIQLNIPYLDFYLDHCSIDNQGYLYPTQYHQGEAPVLRTFIHPAFSMDAFKNLCCTYKTASFQCYSRLLPFNTHTYVGYLFLVDYFNTKHLIGCERELNVHERSLFKGLIVSINENQSMQIG